MGREPSAALDGQCLQGAYPGESSKTVRRNEMLWIGEVTVQSSIILRSN